MNLTKDQILAALPALTPEALKAIQMAAGALLARGQGDSPAENNASAWLYEALQATLGVTYGPKWLKGAQGKQFSARVPQMLEFLTQTFPEHMQQRVTATALMRWLLGLLCSDLRARGSTLSTLAVVNNMPRIRQVFEYYYPGYIGSGLAPKVADHALNRETFLP